MAEERTEGREITWQRLMPWTLLFRAFQVTLDVNKLLLAAGGILATALAWWLLGTIFTAAEVERPPEWKGKYETWQAFRVDRQRWNLLHEARALTAEPTPYEVADIAETESEYNDFKGPEKGGLDLTSSDPKAVEKVLERVAVLEKQGKLTRERAARYRALLGKVKPSGRLSMSPWSEDRGPNPFLLATGQAGIPWEAGHFWDWFSRDQVPVMIEPLMKVVRPVVYFLSPRNSGIWSRLYFLCVILATIAIWSFFGGAITRIAAVQVARGEKIGLFEAASFTARRYRSFLAAPMFPIGVVTALVILLGFLGLIGMYTATTELIGGLLWFIPLLFGLIMTMALVGLMTWPLMAATISTEGTDSWEAATRSYGYLLQRPWHCLWYALVSVAYGGVVIFAVGFLGSMAVYMAKWSVCSTEGMKPTFRSEPTSLFIYAPRSFGWRELLLEGATVQGTEQQQTDFPIVKEMNDADVVTSRAVRALPDGGGTGGVSRHSRIDAKAYEAYLKTLSGWNKFGAVLVAFWLGVAFVLILSFGYVFFWTASTITYMLLRKSLEAAELDEVYLEEEDYDTGYTMPAPQPPAPPAPPAPPSPPSRTSALPVVEAPRQVPAPPASPSAQEKAPEKAPEPPPPPNV